MIKIKMMTCGTCGTTSRTDRRPSHTSQCKLDHAEYTPRHVPAFPSCYPGFQESNNKSWFGQLGKYLARRGAVVPAFKIVPSVETPPVSLIPLLALSPTASTLGNVSPIFFMAVKIGLPSWNNDVKSWLTAHSASHKTIIAAAFSPIVSHLPMLLIFFNCFHHPIYIFIMLKWIWKHH